jgi:opacity protein-like surface antigen
LRQYLGFPLSIDAIVQNGEGYKYVQMDQTVRGGLGITYDPIESLRLRIYYDNSTKPNVQLQSFSGFVGYKFKDKLSIAVEYNKQLNHLLEEGKNLDGASFYTTYFINKKFQVFGRFDYLESNKTEGHPLPWNYNNNGYYMTAGVQMKLAKGICVSANYRGFQSENSHNEFGNMMFVNFEYKLKH